MCRRPFLAAIITVTSINGAVTVAGVLGTRAGNRPGWTDPAVWVGWSIAGLTLGVCGGLVALGASGWPDPDARMKRDRDDEDD